MKRNVHKVPTSVRLKIQNLGKRDIVVGCAQQFKADDIRSGVLKHIFVELSNGTLKFPECILPIASQGKYSARNINGFEVVRKDLPIETQYHFAEAPNWGDRYNGTHTIWLPHKAYPRDFKPPRELEIILHCSNPEATQSSFVFAARVNEVLSQNSPDFEEHLLEDLNLLQENFGACGVEPADTSIADFAQTLRLTWDILPPGSREETLKRLFRGRRPTEEQKNIAISRYEFFQKLNPRKIVIGSSGFRRYFGALLEDNLVIFENIQYGNAIYIMYNNWEILSQRSRIDLLSGRLGNDFDRVVHKNKWETEVKSIVKEKRKLLRPRL